MTGFGWVDVWVGGWLTYLEVVDDAVDAHGPED